MTKYAIDDEDTENAEREAYFTTLWHHSELPIDVLARHIAKIRPWTYFVTLTCRGWKHHGELEKALLKWAQKCQRKIGSDFEYVAIPEQPDPTEATHFHMLLHLQAKPSAEVRMVLDTQWPYGYTKIKSVQRIRSGFLVARYMLKDFDFGEGKIHRPIYKSPSLSEDWEEMERRRLKKQAATVSSPKRRSREARYWAEGYAS